MNFLESVWHFFTTICYYSAVTFVWVIETFMMVLVFFVGGFLLGRMD